MNYLITTGDPDGIGLEITLKSLKRIKPKKTEKFIFFSEPLKKSNYFVCDDLKIALASKESIVNLQSDKSAAHWVFEAARFCMDHNACIVTGPLSKQLIFKNGFSEIGHTEILKKVSGCKNVFMTFLGRDFNVALLTDHCELKKVEKQLTGERIAKLVGLLRNSNLFTPAKKIALLALNPHAGDSGVISSFDEHFLKPIAERLQIEGPLPPDSAFLKSFHKKFSVYVACYHDQGLIPFKMHHGFESGVHISLGLPFIRTSVDHGTAKDLFGKNKADYRSMLLAIETARKLNLKKDLLCSIQ